MAAATRDRRIFTQLRHYLALSGARPTGWLTGAVLASLALAALDMVGVAAMIPLSALLTGSDVDSGITAWLGELLGTTERSTLIPVLAGGIAVLFVVKSLAAIGFRWWLLGRTTRVSALVATHLLRGYMLAPYAVHRRRQLSEVYRNITGGTTQATSVLMATLTLFTDLLLLAAIVTVMALTAPMITLATVLLFAVFVLGLQRSLRRRQTRIGEEIADADRQAWGFLTPGLDGFREARLTSSAKVFIAGFRQARLRSARAARQMALVSEAPRYALEVAYVIAIAGIAVVLFATGTPTQALTVLSVFAAASLRALPSLNRVASSLATVRVGRVGLGIVTEAASHLKADGAHDEAPRSTRAYSGDMELRGVSFRYPDSATDVLRDVTLTVREKQTTAFVGSSGAGKSTLIDLILGLLTPTQGEVVCGGRPILDDPATWYLGLGVVPQDVFLVNDSLRANIAFGVRTAHIDDKRVDEVIAMAQLTSLVAELPDGVDTLVGERGVRLSGGQRQRIGLARALYRRPSVLLLDEATSALDNETEHQISQTLAQLRGRLTILIVAHRLSTVRDADTLVFLKDGMIGSAGTFDELAAASTDFARLIELGRLD